MRTGLELAPGLVVVGVGRGAELGQPRQDRIEGGGRRPLGELGADVADDGIDFGVTGRGGSRDLGADVGLQLVDDSAGRVSASERRSLQSREQAPGFGIIMGRQGIAQGRDIRLSPARGVRIKGL